MARKVLARNKKEETLAGVKFPVLYQKKKNPSQLGGEGKAPERTVQARQGGKKKKRQHAKHLVCNCREKEGLPSQERRGKNSMFDATKT